MSVMPAHTVFIQGTTRLEHVLLDPETYSEKVGGVPTIHGVVFMGDDPQGHDGCRIFASLDSRDSLHCHENRLRCCSCPVTSCGFSFKTKIRRKYILVREIYLKGSKTYF